MSPLAATSAVAEQRQHAAEPAVADVVRQRHRRVADLGREQLDQERRDRAVHHGDVDHHDDQRISIVMRPVDVSRSCRAASRGIAGVRRAPRSSFASSKPSTLVVADLGDRPCRRAPGASRRRERQARLGQEVLRPVAVGELADHGPTKMWNLQVGRPPSRVIGVLLRERLERRVDVVGQRREQREVGQRRDQAAGQDDLQPADLVGEPAEEDEERRAEQQRQRRSACTPVM